MPNNEITELNLCYITIGYCLSVVIKQCKTLGTVLAVRTVAIITLLYFITYMVFLSLTTVTGVL